MRRSFDDLVDTSGLTPGERQRLESVHDLLVSSGPPPELPLALAQPPQPADLDGAVISISSRPRRSRRTVGALLAAAVAAACFGGGYLLGHNSSDGQVMRVVPMQGVGRQTAHASVSLGAAQRGGNWPIVLTVTGLPQSGEHGYYELFVWRDGKPGYPCVGFKTHAGTTTVRFTVPYELKETTDLRVTSIERGKNPGRAASS